MFLAAQDRLLLSVMSQLRNCQRRDLACQGDRQNSLEQKQRSSAANRPTARTQRWLGKSLNIFYF